MDAQNRQKKHRTRLVASAALAVVLLLAVSAVLVVAGRTDDDSPRRSSEVEPVDDTDDSVDADDEIDIERQNPVAVETIATETEVWDTRTGYNDTPVGLGSEPGQLWEVTADGLDDVVGDAGQVVLLDYDRSSSQRATVIAIDPSTGNVLWTQNNLPGNGYVSDGFTGGRLELLGNDLVQVGYSDDDDRDWTVLIDRVDGRIVLELADVASYSTERVGDVFVDATSDTLVGTSISSGDELWRLRGVGLPNEYDGSIHIDRRTNGQELMWESGPLDQSSGTMLWTRAHAGGTNTRVFNDTLFAVAIGEPDVIAVDTNTGVERWANSYGTDSLRVVPATSDLTAVSGSELWGVDVDGEVVWQIGGQGGDIVSVRIDDQPYVLSRGSRPPRWIDGATGEIVATGCTKISLDAIFAAGVAYDVSDGVLTGTSLTSMEMLWQIAVSDNSTLVGTFDAGVVIVDGDRVTAFGGVDSGSTGGEPSDG